MKTKILFLAFFTAASLSLSAQFGARVGYNFANARVDFGELDVSTGGSEGKFMAGLFFNIPLAGEIISIQPEINYMGRGYTLETGEITDIPTDYNFAYFDAGGLPPHQLWRRVQCRLLCGRRPFLQFCPKRRY